MFTQLRSKIYFWHLFMALLVVKYAILTAIELHQYLYIHGSEVPRDLVGFVDHDHYTGLRVNEVVKFKVNFWESFIACAIYVLTIGFGLLEKSWRCLHVGLDSSSLLKNVVLQSLLFYGIYVAIQTFIFTNLIWGPRELDMASDSVLGRLIAPYKGLEHILNTNIIYRDLVIIAYYTLLPTYSSLWMVLVLAVYWVLEEVNGLFFQPDAILRQTLPCSDQFMSVVTPLLERVGFPPERFHCIDIKPYDMNAFSAGIGPKGVIAVGTSLSPLLTIDEIVAYVAHELGHWVNWHCLIAVFPRLILKIVSLAYIAYFVRQPSFYRSFGVELGPNPDKLLPYGVGLILTRALESLVLFLLVPLVNWISWIAEYQADAFSVHMGYGTHLLSGLKTGIDNGSRLATAIFGIFSTDHPVLSNRFAAIVKAMG